VALRICPCHITTLTEHEGQVRPTAHRGGRPSAAALHQGPSEHAGFRRGLTASAYWPLRLGRFLRPAWQQTPSQQIEVTFRCSRMPPDHQRALRWRDVPGGHQVRQRVRGAEDARMASAGRKDAYGPHMLAIIAAWIEGSKVGVSRSRMVPGGSRSKR
jgi:hypothetical protein